MKNRLLAPRQLAPRQEDSSGARTHSMSFLKRLERNFTALFKLGRTEWTAKTAKREVDQVSNEVQTLRSDVAELQSIFHENQAETVAVRKALSETRMAFSDLSRRMDALLQSGRDETGSPSFPDIDTLKSAGFDAYIDSFYHQLENRYRGSREDIQNRLRVYLPEVEAAVIRTRKKPVLDIGCGRGEWLQLLASLGISAFGVDSNPVQIHDEGTENLDIRLGDALQTLTVQETGSLSAITAFHLIEHLPFETVALITREAQRVLAPGGILIYETPNPRNILVGASSFYNDPTHRNPVTESVLQVLFEATGFNPIEMRPLHPHERLDSFLQRPGFDPELAYILFGPQDLAAFGTKPA